MFLSVAEKPSLGDLMIIGDYVIIDIVKCSSYRRFTAYLLNDKDGRIVKELEEKHKDKTGEIVYDVLCQWVNGSGRECIWKHVLLALKACGHRQEAEAIQQHLCSEHF